MKIFLLSLCIVLLASCASSPIQKKIRQYISAHNYEKARGYIEGSAIKKKERNKLLYHLERGQLFFLEKKNLEATREWEKARETLKGFYKKKTVDRLLNTIANNNYEDFHAEVFEQYQLFFQLSLAYIRLAQQKGIKSQLRSQYLFSARAVILDWDSFIKAVGRNKKLKVFYKESFLARFWGSLVHEMIGSRNDLQISYQLMKDAAKIKSQNHDKLRIHFLGNKVKNMIGSSLIRVARKLGRKKDIGKWESQFLIKSKNIKLNPIIVIVDSGLISFKKASRVPFSLDYTFRNPSLSLRSSLLGVGVSAFSSFSRGILGLGYYPSRYERTPYVHFNYQLNGSAIDFELAVREAKSPGEKQPLRSISLGGEDVTESFKAFVSLSDLSRSAIDVDYEKNYFKTGLRAAWKYLSAIMASYRVYRSSIEQQGKRARSTNSQGRHTGLTSASFARFRANTTFALMSAVIRASERADLRHWTSLPSKLFLAELSLGKSDSKIIKVGGQEIGEVERKSQGLEIFSFSLPEVTQAQ